MKKIFYALLLGAVLSGFTACTPYPDQNADVYDQLMAITEWDTETDFVQPNYQTYAISDSFAVLDKNGKVQMVMNRVATLVGDQIRLNMNRLGYRETTESEDPDLVFNLSGVEKTTYLYSYPYYGFYNPYYWDPYYGGWGYYYPVYPMLTASYVSNSILMEMVDLKHADVENKKLKVIWMGILRGVMSYTFSDDQVIQGVNDCFNQTKALPFSDKK